MVAKNQEHWQFGTFLEYKKVELGSCEFIIYQVYFFKQETFVVIVFEAK